MNMHSFNRRWLTGIAFTVIAATVANAQISKLSDAEKGTRGVGPPGASSTVTAASTDPRDFSGSWRSAGGPGGGGAGGMGAGGAPGAGGPPGGGAPGGGDPGAGGAPGAFGSDSNPAGNVGASGQLPARILCLPQDPLYTGVDGPTLIVQTPAQIVWAAEEMHHQRRIYLTGEHTQNFKPNYLGESIGKWEGNTLVVDTIGLKSQAAGTRMIERWIKSADGKTLDISYGYVDAQGKAKGADRKLSLGWSNGQDVYEWICEDFNEEWLPGGADYDDQIAK